MEKDFIEAEMNPFEQYTSEITKKSGDFQSGSQEEDQMSHDDGSIESIEGTVKKKLGYLGMSKLTVCFCGVQFGWAIQIAFATPIFLELGVSTTGFPLYGWLVQYQFLQSVIFDVGLLVQPTVGAISDHLENKTGRRRPFIFWGTVCVILGMLLISNAKDMGVWFGDNADSNPGAIFIAVVGFWVLDLSNNTIQGPCRALLVDMTLPEEQELGNAFFSFMLGMGNLSGYFIGSLDLKQAFPFFGTNMRALFLIGIVVEIVCISITLRTTKETPHKNPPGFKRQNPFVEIFSAIRHMPNSMVRVCVVQFFAWVGWFAFIIYTTAWVAEDIFNGDPNAPDGSELKERYEEGVRKGAFGLSLFSLVTMLYSPILPRLITRFKSKPMYFMGQLTLGLGLICAIETHTETGALVMISVCGIPWATTMTIPFAIVGRLAGEENSGLYMGVFNIFVVLPQLFVAFGAGFIVSGYHDLAAALVAGGISSLIAGVFVWFLIIPGEKTPVDQEELLGVDDIELNKLDESTTVFQDDPESNEPISQPFISS